jgi:hypothetical protein
MQWGENYRFFPLKPGIAVERRDAPKPAIAFKNRSKCSGSDRRCRYARCRHAPEQNLASARFGRKELPHWPHGLGRGQRHRRSRRTRCAHRELHTTSPFRPCKIGCSQPAQMPIRCRTTIAGVCVDKGARHRMQYPPALESTTSIALRINDCPDLDQSLNRNPRHASRLVEPRLWVGRKPDQPMGEVFPEGLRIALAKLRGIPVQCLRANSRCRVGSESDVAANWSPAVRSSS